MFTTFSALSDDMLSELGRVHDRAVRMRPPAFARAHDAIRRHGELLRVLHALEPSAFTKVQLSYANSVSTIIRWAWLDGGSGSSSSSSTGRRQRGLAPGASTALAPAACLAAVLHDASAS
jgi:hypothetical protein